MTRAPLYLLPHSLTSLPTVRRTPLEVWTEAADLGVRAVHQAAELERVAREAGNLSAQLAAVGAQRAALNWLEIAERMVRTLTPMVGETF